MGGERVHLTTQALAQEVLDVAIPHGFPFYAALGTAVRGVALVRQGQGADGLALLRQGLGGLYTTGTQPAPHCLDWQAELYGYVGQPAEGLGRLAEAHVQADTTGNYHALAGLYRLQGEFILALSATRASEAKICFHEALAVAQRQQAKSLELRAAMSLSRLCSTKASALQQLHSWRQFMPGSLRVSPPSSRRVRRCSPPSPRRKRFPMLPSATARMCAHRAISDMTEQQYGNDD